VHPTNTLLTHRNTADDSWELRAAAAHQNKETEGKGKWQPNQLFSSNTPLTDSGLGEARTPESTSLSRPKRIGCLTITEGEEDASANRTTRN